MRRLPALFPALGDVLGECWCEFDGPPITVTLEGSFPLTR
jgi:hypothetical protein